MKFFYTTTTTACVVTVIVLSLLAVTNVDAFISPTGLFSTNFQSTTELFESTATTVDEEQTGAGGVKPYKAPVTEIDRRRNLAIISHPDSGKTTMTEKLLLYGGALQQAGAVRHKAEQRATQSDFMAMEQERGISISSTVMNFDYQGYRLNILDTPGHQE